MKKQKTLKVLCASVLAATLIGTVPTNVFANEVKTEHDLVELNRASNLVKNEKFNSSQYWNIVGQNSGVVNGAGKIGKTTDRTANGHVWQDVTVKQNTDYILTADVKVLGGEGAFATLDVKKGGSTVGGYFIDKKVEYTDGQYKTVELQFNSKDQTKIAVGIGRWTENATATQKNSEIFIDNVELVEKNATKEEKYDILWADDFNGTELDQSKWGYELGCIRGVEQQHYVADKENVFMRDGNLVLKATDRDVKDQYNHPRDESRKVIYNSGSVRTHGKQEFLYGRIEMRAKLPKGQGVFPAFWTLGADFPLDGRISGKQGYGWARCGEIDIMELTGQRQTNSYGNRTVYQTVHTDYQGYKKYAGTSYTIDEEFNNDYHVFGLNWSPNKLEWYVDDQIVTTLDYSNDIKAQRTLNRPQYIQFNLAMGGAWPGLVDTNLAGTEYDIDYVYYAQNDDQKAAAAEYYETAPTLEGYKNLTMYEGQTPDLLKDVTTSEDYFVDFSIENEPMFETKGGLTSVDLLCSGKDDMEGLSQLPAGTYNLHYTAIPKNVEYENDGNNVKNGTDYKFNRKTVTLTVLDAVETKDLDQVITETEELLQNKDQYDADAIKALETKLQEAKDLLGQYPTQEQIDAMKAGLTNALEFAKAHKKETVIPTPTPEGDNETTQPQEKPQTGTDDAVQTADTTNVAVFVGGAMVAALGMILLNKKRKSIVE